MLLTTQYLDEAEQLADRIAILHEGRIIANGTLAELKALLPPAEVEYVEKQPTLEDIFLALIGHDTAGTPRRPHDLRNDDEQARLGDTAALTGRSLRHILRSPDTIITTAITPIAMHAAVRLRVRRRDRHRRRRSTSNYLLPGILLITVASGIAYTAYRLFIDMSERDLRAVPVDADRPLGVLWAHVLTSLVANLVSLVLVVLVASGDGLPLGGRRARLARGGRHPRAVHAGADLAGGDRRPGCEVGRWARAGSPTR